MTFSLPSLLVRAVLGLGLLSSAPLRGQDATARAQSSALYEAVDAIARRALQSGRLAGVSIGVEQGGEVLVEDGWGFAHVELEVPATAHTVYRIGSVTKQFTAAAILRQVELGRLSLDAPVEEVLPEFDMKGHDLRVHHLLNHTSGIASYTGMPEFWEHVDRDLDHREMIALMTKHPFDFAPGEKFLYNNSAYYLLGVILERVTGQTYEEVLHEEFFEPLEMTCSCYGWTRPLLKGRASGYEFEEGQLVNCRTMSMAAPGAAGALCSTVGDLLRWNRGLCEGLVVDEDSYRRMTTPGALNDGARLQYGYGLTIAELPGGVRALSHGGGIFGFTSFLIFVPDENLSVAVLTNCSTSNPEGIAGQVVHAVLTTGPPSR